MPAPPEQASQYATDARIWRVVAEIPAGKVASYGQIARLAGLGRAARRVAPALRRAPDSMQLPWHRVLRANGAPGLPQGSLAWHAQLQKLSSEGTVNHAGRIDMQQYRWQAGRWQAGQHDSSDLDELLWRMD